MTIGLGDFDKDSIHNLTVSNKFPAVTRNITESDIESGFAFPTDTAPLETGESDIFVTDEEVLEKYVSVTISNLTEVERHAALRAYYKDQLRSKRVEQKIEEHRQKMLGRARVQEWLKYLLFFVSFLLLIAFVAIVGTVIYTSLLSGSMSETGVLAAIISFFSEIIRILITN